MRGNPAPVAVQATLQVRQVMDHLVRITEQASRGGGSVFSRLSFDPEELRAELRAAQESLGNLEIALRAQAEEHHQLQAIQQVSQDITSTLDLTTVLDRAMDTIIQLTGAERGFLMLLDPAQGELTFRVARNMDRETLAKSSFKISQSIVRRVAREGKPIVTTNAQADPRFSMQESVVSYSLRSILCVPLQVRGDLIGVIYADNRAVTGLFDDRDRDLAASFANQAAVAIQNARFFEQVTAQLKAITAMKNLMDNVLASIASGVVTTDQDDRVTLVNRAAEAILGVGADGVLGRPCVEALPALQRIWSVLVSRVKAGGVQSSEVAAETAARGPVVLNLQLSPLRDAQQQMLGVAMVVDDLTEKRRRERTIAHVCRYLHPALVDSLPDIDTLQLGGTRRTISILFGDVRGFCAFGEQMQPEAVVDTINRYFTVAADAILLHDGIIDKFVGDAVMALFNTPLLPQEDHASRAVRAALALRYDVAALRETLPPEKQLRMGIGVHTGDAVLGNIGSPDRLDFSAIGDAVNLAKRLQEVAAPDQILISQAVYQSTRDWVHAVPLPPIQVRGRQTLEQVYQLVGLRGR